MKINKSFKFKKEKKVIKDKHSIFSILHRPIVRREAFTASGGCGHAKQN